MINRLDGVSEEGIVARIYHETPDGIAQQLMLFEDGPEYAGETEP